MAYGSVRETVIIMESTGDCLPKHSNASTTLYRECLPLSLSPLLYPCRLRHRQWSLTSARGDGGGEIYVVRGVVSIKIMMRQSESDQAGNCREWMCSQQTCPASSRPVQYSRLTRLRSDALPTRLTPVLGPCHDLVPISPPWPPVIHQNYPHPAPDKPGSPLSLSLTDK